MPGAGPPRGATRTIQVSPFASDATLYLGGYDANKIDAHDTAWSACGKIEAIVGTKR